MVDMNDTELINTIADKAGIPVAYHIGSKNCYVCHGSGFMPTPFVIKLKAFFIDRVPWKFIRKEVWCTKCKGNMVIRWPKKNE